MLIPPVKLYDRGQFRQDIVDILQSNSRQPGSLYGDLNGQLSALELGGRRLDALIAEYGLDMIRAALAELRRRAEQLMRANIAELPDGPYSAAEWLDNGGNVNQPLLLTPALTVPGNRIPLD